MLLKLLNFYFSTSTLGVVLPDQVMILFPLFYICMLFTLFQRNLLRYCQNQSTHSHRNLIFFLVKTATYFSKLINSDLEICTEDFVAESSTSPKDQKLKKAPNEDDESKPDWIDMLVEMLLNLLTINKAWLRTSVKIQFKKMIPNLTYNSVKMIVDVICFFFIWNNLS